jgi:hypothetical protein
MTSEAAVQQALQLAAPRLGCHLMRNNVGACVDESGRMIRYGLGNVSAQQTKHITSVDLIGWRCSDGRFLAVECKRPGWKEPKDAREQAQLRFLTVVCNNGGLGGFATCVEDLERILQQ